MIGERDRIAERLGTRPVVAAGEVASAFGLEAATPPSRAAAAIGARASIRLAAGDMDDLAGLEPIYVRAPRGLATAAAEAGIRWL